MPSGRLNSPKLQAIKHGLSLGGTTEKTSVEVAVEMQPWQRILTGVSHTETREEAARRRGDTRTLEAIGANADEFVVDAEVVDDDEDDEEPAELPTQRWKPSDAGTDEHDTDPSAYAATAPPLTGMQAIEAAADANRAAGVWSKKKRRR